MNTDCPDPLDNLPESLVLALLDDARRRHEAQTGQTVRLSISQISDASGIPVHRLHYLNRLAGLKLRQRCADLGLHEFSDSDH